MNEVEFAVLIGIDWGDRAHHVVVWDVEQRARTERTVEQTPEALHAWMSTLVKRYGRKSMAVAVEQSRGALVHALMNYPTVVVYPTNPKSLARYRDAFRPGGAKDDPTDAELLNDLLRTHRDRLRPWKPDDTHVRTLRLLVEDRRGLVDRRTALTNRLQSRLKEYYPQALTWAGGLDSFQACDFLERWPDLGAIRKVTLTRLTQFYRQHASPLSGESLRSSPQTRTRRSSKASRARVSGSHPDCSLHSDTIGADSKTRWKWRNGAGSRRCSNAAATRRSCRRDERARRSSNKLSRSTRGYRSANHHGRARITRRDGSKARSDR